MLDQLTLTIEHKILIVLYLMSYFGAMVLQIVNPDKDVTFVDWVLTLIFSFIGGVLCYFGVMSWANIGMRFGITIIVSLLSYRTFVFIISDKSQNQFAEGFFKGIMGLLSALVSKTTNENNKDE